MKLDVKFQRDRIYLKDMNKCLRITVNGKRHWFYIIGCDLNELSHNMGLIFEIVRTIGLSQGIESLKNPEEIVDVKIEQEHPDFIVKVYHGQIEVVDFI